MLPAAYNLEIKMPSITFNPTNGRHEFVGPSGKMYSSVNKSYVESTFERFYGENATPAESESKTEMVKDEKEEFSVDMRFAILKRNIKMVVAGLQKSLIITGQGGIGKSHTVRTTLEECGLARADEIAAKNQYVVVGGYSTAKGLYTELYNNRNSTIVFDDCDSIQKDAIACDILKNALDSSDKRVISWKADMKNEEIPRSFEFTGNVIFISNMDKSQFNQALISRSNCIDLKMTTEQKIERMEDMILDPEFLPEIHLDKKIESLDLIKELQNRAKEISLRTLIKVANIRMMFSGREFTETATYTLTN